MSGPRAMRPGTITVSGHGWAEGPPDLAAVALGVECRSGSVDAAFSAAEASLAAVSGALRGAGAADGDLQSNGLTVRADLAWRDGGSQEVAGYVATATLAARLRDLQSVPAILAAAVAAGGDNIRLNSLQLCVEDAAVLRERARAAAWEDAVRSAGQLAALAGATLGRVVSVAEQPAAGGPVPLAGLQRMSAAEGIPLEPGLNREEAAVTVSWELVPGRPGVDG
ncbi:SIMPL domain-containing protein [Pseudarthrobacter sp. NPDC092424]|uniref:SIMPL domain-containing protein n=1 Tax=Pseudarthrobacter sp. NPDC092424 TaxID=3364415 RepID=UPI003829A15C